MGGNEHWGDSYNDPTHAARVERNQKQYDVYNPEGKTAKSIDAKLNGQGGGGGFWALAEAAGFDDVTPEQSKALMAAEVISSLILPIARDGNEISNAGKASIFDLQAWSAFAAGQNGVDNPSTVFSSTFKLLQDALVTVGKIWGHGGHESVERLAAVEASVLSAVLTDAAMHLATNDMLEPQAGGEKHMATLTGKFTEVIQSPDMDGLFNKKLKNGQKLGDAGFREAAVDLLAAGDLKKITDGLNGFCKDRLSPEDKKKVENILDSIGHDAISNIADKLLEHPELLKVAAAEASRTGPAMAM